MPAIVRLSMRQAFGVAADTHGMEVLIVQASTRYKRYRIAASANRRRK